MKEAVHKSTSNQLPVPKVNQTTENTAVHFNDARPEAVLQGKFQQMANASSNTVRLNNMQNIANSKGGGHSSQHNGVVQRAVILHDTSGSKAFAKAYKIFIQALESQGGEIGHYLEFVNDKSNHHNLIFRTLPAKPKKAEDTGELHGSTNVVFSGTSEDIIDHMFKENLDPNERIEEIMHRVDPVVVMRGVDVLIDIVVSPEMTEPILLETLNHEFTVHAIQWHKFIRTTFAKDQVKAMQELRARIGTMRADHDDFGSNRNQLYKNVRRTIFEAIDQKKEPVFTGFELPETQAEEFMRISRDAIRQHRPKELVDREMRDLLSKTDDLIQISQPLLSSRRKRTPPKKNKCCYITTACAKAKGLPDNCEELMLLRYFRDTYLINKPNGKQLIEIYYEHSPIIINRIRQREDEEEILKILYGIIKRCAEAIKRGNMEFAYETYCEMVLRLKELFLPDIECDLPEIYS